MTTLAPGLNETLSRCLAGRPEIRFALLYGSAAEEVPFRDLDIGVYVDRASVPPHEDWTYAFALADEMSSVVPYPVDVCVINDAPLPFRYNVSKGIALVVNDSEAFFTFLERTWDEFLDFRPVAMRYLEELRWA
jgi:predicted nucleotidyltransferase